MHPALRRLRDVLNSPKGRGWIVLGLTLLASIFYLRIRWMSVTWMGDDGFFFVGAQRILRGEAVYRDFAIHITPGTYYFLAAVLRLTGESWETTRILWLLTTLLQGAGVYLIVRRLTASATLGVLGFVVLTAWSLENPVFLHHHLSAALAFGSTWAWWRWLETRRGLFAVAAGLADGLVGFTSQNKGFFLLVASIGIVLLLGEPDRRARLRVLARYALGGGAVAILFGAILCIQGSAGGFYRDGVVWLFRGYSDGSHLPYAASLGFLDAQRGWSYAANLVFAAWIAAAAPVSVLVEGGLSIAGRRLRPFTALLALQGLALWAGALHRPDLIDHLRLSAHLPVALLLVQLHEAWKSGAAAAGFRKAASHFSVGMLVLLGAACPVVVESLARQGLGEDRVPLPSLGARAWTPFIRLAQTVDGLSRHLDARMSPGEPIFVLPHSSLYYVALRRTNATRVDIPSEAPGLEPQIEEIIAGLERDKVRFIVVDETFTPEFERVLFPRLTRGFLQGKLMEYIRRRYVQDARFPKASVWRRAPE